MERNAWADKYVDCVVKRAYTDMYMKTGMMVALLIIPAFIGLAISLAVTFSNGDLFNLDDEAPVAFVMCVMAECTIGSFLLFLMTRGSRNHLKRDLEWMDSLIGYVESRHVDASGMRRARGDAAKGAWTVKYVFSMIMWSATVAYTAVIGFAAYSDMSLIEGNIPYIIGLGHIFVIVQFIFTVSTTSRFPRKHDKVQCEFTRELSACLRRIGIHHPPLNPSTSGLGTFVSIILFVATLGLYSIPMALMGNMSLNRHLKKQWDYETDLMEKIIRDEGGVGVEGVKTGEPKGLARRVLGSLF